MSQIAELIAASQVQHDRNAQALNALKTLDSDMKELHAKCQRQTKELHLLNERCANQRSELGKQNEVIEQLQQKIRDLHADLYVEERWRKQNSQKGDTFTIAGKGFGQQQYQPVQWFDFEIAPNG